MNNDTWVTEEAAPRDRWLLSYADLVTLLLAFFVVMYSVSAVNEVKLSELASTLSASFDPSQLEPTDIAQAGSLEQVLDKLTTQISSEVSIAKISEGGLGNELKIELPGELLFASGTAELSDSGLKQLKRLMPTLELVTGEIVVEGHTDSQQISSAKFPSNWELSAHRAASVVRQLESWGVNAKLAAKGMGASLPVDTNDTSEGREKNRRVVFYATGIDWLELSKVVEQQELQSSANEPPPTVSADDPASATLEDGVDSIDLDEIDPALLEQVLRQLEAEGN